LNKGIVKKNKFKSIIYQTMKYILKINFRVPLDEKLFDIIEKHYG